MVFLSHAGDDKTRVVEPVARALAALGVTPWLDKWEIQPGDSLVRKLFDEGIERASAVAVFLSEHSVDRPWVREELDAAAVQRIQAGTRLIPVRLDDSPVPSSLRHLVFLDARGLDPEAIARQIANVVLGYDPRPAVSAPPAYAGLVPSVPGLTSADETLLCTIAAEALAEGRLYGLDGGRVQRAAADAGIDGDLLSESVTALGQRGFITYRSVVPGQLHQVGLNLVGYAAVIDQVYPEHQEALLGIIAALVNDPPTGIKIIDDPADRTGTPRLVVDQTLRALEEQHYVAVIRTMGNHSRLHAVSPTLKRLLA